MSGINVDPTLSDALSPNRSPADPPSKTSFLPDLQSKSSWLQPVSQKTRLCALIGQRSDLWLSQAGFELQICSGWFSLALEDCM